ncbi:MAG: hypothetical protein CVU02_00920 [Bacteroidetes bacterium HGW-Bacteroidetes-19]|nr:MAG: hypothetical protein CVU02_00920 [Bacteroidetes bacterium HGW-Bacteroidetes-19]
MIQQKRAFGNLIFLFITIIFISCNQKRENPEEIFNEKTPGRKVIDTYSNNNPQVVYFYQVDEQGKNTDKKVGEMYYYENKKVFVGGGTKNNKREGVWKAYHPNGKVQTDAFYIDGKEDGTYTVYFDNGKVYYTGEYNKGICSGKWKFYDTNGVLQKTIRAEGDNLVCGACERCNKINQNNKK